MYCRATNLFLKMLFKKFNKVCALWNFLKITYDLKGSHQSCLTKIPKNLDFPVLYLGVTTINLQIHKVGKKNAIESL